jgi:hypothetical protein
MLSGFFLAASDFAIDVTPSNQQPYPGISIIVALPLSMLPL